MLLIFFLFSCKRSNDDNSSKIRGKWISAKQTYITSYDKDGEEFPPPPPRENLGLSFYSEDSCEANFPFFKVDFSDNSDVAKEFIFARNVKEKLNIRSTKIL
ncbi:hypothetical protein [Frigoriflavimonas asaccharolytica]|uniref:Uncharacterized protein n=1 Tax=Frigoriflavimonas asaccharolytica TaxID=2735899 RepID=A0A8J8G889_9FLAO|nr:hypothetical protein [Frigoriflavimonas asaccharolytica]NRS92495.1 hypothetical protein [Frigoriflavimonas asaccharolytica]